MNDRSTAPQVFEYRFRVEFEDLDVNGHATTYQYINFFERARSAALESQGLTFKEFMAIGYGLVIAEVNLRFAKPAFLADHLFVYTKVVARTQRSMTIEQVITKDALSDAEKLVAYDTLPQRMTSGRFVLVCVDGKTKKVAVIPDEIQKFLPEPVA